MDPERYAAMREDTLELMRRWNRAEDELRLDAEYLLIVARKRG